MHVGLSIRGPQGLRTQCIDPLREGLESFGIEYRIHSPIGTDKTDAQHPSKEHPADAQR